MDKKKFDQRLEEHQNRDINICFKRLIDHIIIMKKKFLRHVEDYGITHSLKRTTRFLVSPVFQKPHLIIYEIDIINTPEKQIPKKGYAFKLLEPKDSDFIDQIEVIAEYLKGKLKAKLSTNGICMAVIEQNRVVGFNLASAGEVYLPFLKARVITDTDEAWSEQITIHKDHRKKGLGGALRNRFYAELRKKGFKALYGHREKFNIASERSAKEYTSRLLVKAEYLKIITFEILRYSKLPADIKDEKKKGYQRLLRNNIENNWHYVKPNKSAEHLFTIEVGDFKS
jgi:GNAT superfamily N-acetyltransferase